jgi:hypothetical protein
MEKEKSFKKDALSYEKIEISTLTTTKHIKGEETVTTQPVIPVQITNLKDNTHLIVNLSVPYCPFCGIKNNDYFANSQEITQFLNLKD